MTRPKRILKIITVERYRTDNHMFPTEAYVCDNGETYDKDELAAAVGINPNTLKVRFYRSEGDIFTEELLKPVTGQYIEASYKTSCTNNKRIKNKKAAWERSYCKRNSILCKHYSDCQNRRLLLKGAGTWDPPENTDECYKAAKPPGTLHAVSYP